MKDDKKSSSIAQVAMLKQLLELTKSPEDLNKANSSDFHRTITEASKNNPMIKANVTPYSLEDYNKFNTYLSDDMKSGYAIKPGTLTDTGKDELISVFSTEKGRGKDILKHAVDVGGAKQLDAFDINNKLPSLYGTEFNEKYRYKFDPQYAPKDWDYEKLGTPDVIGMDLKDDIQSKAKRLGRKIVRHAKPLILPAAVATTVATSDDLGEAISNLLIPGGVEGVGEGSDQPYITPEEAEISRDMEDRNAMSAGSFARLRKALGK